VPSNGASGVSALVHSIRGLLRRCMAFAWVIFFAGAMKMLRRQRNGPFVANQVSASRTCFWQRRLLNSDEWKMRARLPSA